MLGKLCAYRFAAESKLRKENFEGVPMAESDWWINQALS
jgi:hypothetical protein